MQKFLGKLVLSAKHRCRLGREQEFSYSTLHRTIIQSNQYTPFYTTTQFSPTGHIRDPLQQGLWMSPGFRVPNSSFLKICKIFTTKYISPSNDSPQPLPCPHLSSQGEQPPCSCSSGKGESSWDWNVTDSEDMINYLNRQNYIPLVTFSSTSTLPLPLPFPPCQPPAVLPPVDMCQQGICSFHSVLC